MFQAGGVQPKIDISAPLITLSIPLKIGLHYGGSTWVSKSRLFLQRPTDTPVSQGDLQISKSRFFEMSAHDDIEEDYLMNIYHVDVNSYLKDLKSVFKLK